MTPPPPDAERAATLSRRAFVQRTGITAAGLAVMNACGTTATSGLINSPGASADAATALGDAIVLPPLPWAEDALAPVISSETIRFHYGRHHAGYANNLKKLLGGKPGDAFAARSLEDLIRETAQDPAERAVFNNAAQLWNHTFYWNSLTPTPTAPSGELARLIARDFGDHTVLRKKLLDAALGQFGSGWACLVVREGRLEVTATADADSPLLDASRPLLTIDVWEHAYYIDHHNQRGAYAEAVLDRLVAWDVAHARLVA